MSKTTICIRESELKRCIKEAIHESLQEGFMDNIKSGLWKAKTIMTTNPPTDADFRSNPYTYNKRNYYTDVPSDEKIQDKMFKADDGELIESFYFFKECLRNVVMNNKPLNSRLKNDVESLIIKLERHGLDTHRRMLTKWLNTALENYQQH